MALTAGEEQKDDGSWLKDVDFMMFQFKVTLCNKHLEHDWDACPFAYIGERTCRRRDPSRVNYTSNICLDMMQKGRCPRGRSCPAAHTIYEYWLHPHRYRTEMCKVGANCARRICFFAHKPEELRPLPPHLAGTSGPNAGKYSLSATRQAAAAAAAAAGIGSRGMFGNIHQAGAFPREPVYSLADHASWGVNPQADMFSAVGGSPAGCLPFPGVMHRGNMQQQHVAGGVGLFAANDPTGWQQHGASGAMFATPHLAADRHLLTQMQQLGLTGSAPSTPPAISVPMASGSMGSLSAPGHWSDAAGLAAGSSDLVAGQQYYAGSSDGLLHGWQQQQQQQQHSPLLHDSSQAYASQAGLPGASRVLVLQQPQQPQQFMQLLGAQNMVFAKNIAPGQATGMNAGYQPAKLMPGVSSAMVHPGQLATAQGPWML